MSDISLHRGLSIACLSLLGNVCPMVRNALLRKLFRMIIYHFYLKQLFSALSCGGIFSLRMKEHKMKEDRTKEWWTLLRSDHLHFNSHE